MKKLFVMLLSALVLMSGTVLSFAAESVTVTIKAGEHGSVNEKTGEFSIETEEGQDVLLSVKADEGYVIDQIIVNEEEDAAEMEKQEGKSEFETTLESVPENTTVEFTFKESDSSNNEDVSENEDNSDNQGDSDNQGESGADLNGSDNSQENENQGSDNQGSGDDSEQAEEFTIKVTSEGPGSVTTVFENNEGKYTAESSEEDRTISWFADTDQNGYVQSVTINGEEDTERMNRLTDQYVCTTGDVTIHIVFGTSVEPISQVYTVTTSASEGGTITDSFNYTEGNQIVSFKADEGYKIQSVKINGEEKEDYAGMAEGTWQFSEGNQTVEVAFAKVESSAEEESKSDNTAETVDSVEADDVVETDDTVEADDAVETEDDENAASEVRTAKTTEKSSDKSSGESTEKTNTGKGPQTGDSTSIILYGMMGLISLGAVVTLLKRKLN